MQILVMRLHKDKYNTVNISACYTVQCRAPHLHCCIILWANHYLLLHTYPFPPLAASIRHSVSITLPHICKSIFHMGRIKILSTVHSYNERST
jgi:hypothetical protein